MDNNLNLINNSPELGNFLNDDQMQHFFSAAEHLNRVETECPEEYNCTFDNDNEINYLKPNSLIEIECATITIGENEFAHQCIACTFGCVEIEQHPSVSFCCEINNPKFDTAISLVFTKLNIRDLLRASEVCKKWKNLASHKNLWKTANFSHMYITDWEKSCKALQKYGSKVLDLRVAHRYARNLENFTCYLNNIEELIFDIVSPIQLIAIIKNMPQLKRLECRVVSDVVYLKDLWKTCCTIELAPLKHLQKLTKLKISSGGTLFLDDKPESVLPFFPKLTHLSLTGFNFYTYKNLENLQRMKKLKFLELGDCKKIEPKIYLYLSRLTNLTTLHLEDGGRFGGVMFAKALTNLEKLQTLELMKFIIPRTAVSVFRNLQRLYRFNIWPNTRIKAGLVNETALRAVANCYHLTWLCWGVITEDEHPPTIVPMRFTDPPGCRVENLRYPAFARILKGLKPDCKILHRYINCERWNSFCCTYNRGI